jgi:hypothetical protein
MHVPEFVSKGVQVTKRGVDKKLWQAVINIAAKTQP